MSSFDLQAISSSVNKKELELMQEKYKRDLLLDQISNLEKEIEDFQNLINHSQEATVFLKQRAADIRSQGLSVIEKNVSDGLTYMFQEDYSFKFKQVEKPTESTGYNLVPTLYKNIGGKVVEKDPYSSNGGGLIEIISILLRFSFLCYRKYNGLVILDEALASVSADHMMDRLVDFFKTYVDEIGFQVLFISHRAERFCVIADKIFLVDKKNGLAQVNQKSVREILDHYARINSEIA